MDETTKPDPTLADLGRHTGTETWWRHPMFPGFLYTDGVRYVADNAGAHWLVEAILSHQGTPAVAAEPFQAWTLTVDLAGRTADLVATDGGKHGRRPREIARQAIPFTDFPRRELVLWLEGETLLLPSEH